jgi:hypothetical protein
MPMDQLNGRNCGFSLLQRYLGDVAEQARGIPRSSVRRTLRLGAVAAVRATAGPRPHWTTLFTKALAFVAGRQPVLRQSWQTWPRAHLYEHPMSVAAVAVERALDDELPGFWATVAAPEQLGLLQLDAQLKRFREEPAERIGQVRRCLGRCRQPTLLRSARWWLDGHWSGPRRARRLGTFAVANVGMHGAAIVEPLYPASVLLTVGPIDDEGTVEGVLTFDARLLTCATAAQVLAEMERVLMCEIVMELRYFRQLDDLPRAA